MRELIFPPFRIVYRREATRARSVRVWRSERLRVLSEGDWPTLQVQCLADLGWRELLGVTARAPTEVHHLLAALLRQATP